jgi:3-methyladenine DNA glycosylase AlkD
MMHARELLDELKELGKESYKRVLVHNHGVREPCFGVPISELKKIQKRIRKDYQLALDLYASGNYDAMYLAGLIADDQRMTREDLKRWVTNAYGASLPGTTVASVAAGSPHGWDLACEWIEAKDPLVASAGWATLSAIISVKDDSVLDLAAIRKLVQRVAKEIHSAPDIQRYQMNNFIISVGAYIKSLTALALETAEKIGQVHANLGNNDCKVPFAPDYIRKIESRGTIGRKRKSARC